MLDECITLTPNGQKLQRLSLLRFPLTAARLASRDLNSGSTDIADTASSAANNIIITFIIIRSLITYYLQIIESSARIYCVVVKITESVTYCLRIVYGNLS